MTGSIYALLVGIDRYAPNSIIPVPSLQGCANDINAIATYLKTQVGNKWTLQPPQILIDAAATRQGIIDGFQQYLTQADKEDIALFYYSGHGGQEQAPPEFWHLEPDRLDETLVCYDSRTSGSQDLADKELRYLLTQVAKKNPRIVVILDCCHSGSGTRNILQGARLAPQATSKRELSSFILAGDRAFDDFWANSPKATSKKTSIDLPKGRHILLAACRDFQYAMEHQGDDGETRGAFSYFLLKSLSQTNGSLSYLDLARNIEALIKSNVRNQVPQLEATHPEDLQESFLGDAIPERPFYFTLSYDNQSKERGWAIDGGVLQGIPKLATIEETTFLAIFPTGSHPNDLQQISAALAEAKVAQVLTQKSQVEITQGEANLDRNRSYWAVVTSLPLKPLQICIAGENNKVESIQTALQKSLYVEQVEHCKNAELYLQIGDKYEIIQEDRPLVAPFNSSTAAIQALEAIARWGNILNLKSPQRSQIKSQDIEMQIRLIGYEDEEGEIIRNEAVELLNSSEELRLEYQYQDGEWRSPVIQVRLLNHSQEKLYANVIDLAEDYSVAVPFFDERSSVVLPAAKEEASMVAGFEDIVLTIPQEFLAQGITEYRDIFKLIVSTSDFNASLLEQEGFEPPQRNRRGSEPQSSLDRLMDRVYSRNAGRSSKKYDDWIAKEIAVTIVKPRDVEELNGDRSTTLLAGALEVQPHPNLQAKVSLTTLSQTTREIGNITVPTAMWDDGEALASW
ncbi:MAG: caspase domain-containing protein, partial [Pleurocapsa sp.]